MAKYLALLATGVVVARRIWVNENSTKNQVTLQVAQKVKLPEEATVLSNKIAALSQGFDPETVGYNTVTSLISMKGDIAQKMLGTVNEDFSKSDKGIDVSALFGFKTEIQVVENTIKNPKSTKQTPKINPSTEETLLYNGSPIYRHTALVEAGSAKSVYLRHNDVLPKGMSVKQAAPAFTNVEGDDSDLSF